MQKRLMHLRPGNGAQRRLRRQDAASRLDVLDILLGTSDEEIAASFGAEPIERVIMLRVQPLRSPYGAESASAALESYAARR